VISVTPFCLQVASSLDFILLLAFVMSGVPAPTPAQNIFIPPPVPVDSTTGVGTPPVAPRASATADANG
jgi:hypothetical protein